MLNHSRVLAYIVCFELCDAGHSEVIFVKDSTLNIHKIWGFLFVFVIIFFLLGRVIACHSRDCILGTQASTAKSYIHLTVCRNSSASQRKTFQALFFFIFPPTPFTMPTWSKQRVVFPNHVLGRSEAVLTKVMLSYWRGKHSILRQMLNVENIRHAT